MRKFNIILGAADSKVSCNHIVLHLLIYGDVVVDVDVDVDDDVVVDAADPWQTNSFLCRNQP